ncbi:MAG TPA: S8 family serine peptidase [Mycobacteriales bacterium]|nr:S8 family serine peptidase [Mycobacteriales bacterium]
MRKTLRSLLVSLPTSAALLASVALVTQAPAAAAPSGGNGQANSSAIEEGKTYSRFLVHFASSDAASSDDGRARSEIEEVGRQAGQRLALSRRLSTRGTLLSVDRELNAEQARALMDRFARRASVAYVEPDVRMTATLTPNDTDYAKQWHYSEALAGMNLPAAWDSATGAGVTVAVLDTGITTHSDLAANVVGGYDFVSDATAARDGNGRDSNPADQGDWYALGECGPLAGSSNSSWHGTHVAGTIAALTGNAKGVSGVAFNAKIQPVRVLAKCGGTLADIADAITWASGGAVAGIPANPNPAKVINMSLGGSGTCGATYQNAINGAVARGTTVVVAAGNSNANAANYQPSSCTSTVVVASSDREGNRASYSNYGTIVDLTAPGGETATAANGVLSTLNTGTTTPAAESYAYYQGTSMAAPHVAGLAALVLGTQAQTPSQLEATLKAGTRPLPGTCSGGCGAGLADAAKTVASLGPAPSPSPTATATTSPSPSPTATATTSPSPSPTATPSFFENLTDYAILDKKTVESPITVSGRTGNAPATLKVGVDIAHTYRGDVQLDLVAPDGSLYRLKSTSSSDSADNIIATYTVNASTEVANGTWKLRVYDRYSGDTGTLRGWNLTF